MADTIAETKAKRIIILKLPGEALAGLSDQLAFYGYDPIETESLDDAIFRIKGDPRVLIADARLLSDEKSIERIKSLRAENGGAFKCLYVSEDDDFSLRLSAVRAGGDDFFSPPLDVQRIVEKVEALSACGTGKPYQILIVDDDPEQVAYYAYVLQQAGMLTTIALNPKQVLKILVESRPELILMDMYMPECSGPELASVIRQQEAYVSIPIVYLSVETNRDKQFAAISSGADDFLCKPIKPEHLITSVTIRAERTRSMRYFMERDSLTGLLNHTNLKERLANEIMRSRRISSGFCYVMLDIDHFKEINDTHGHLVGDRVLKSLSRLLQERLRKTDIIGRYGGEEFGIILLNANEEQSRVIMDEIRENFGRIRHVAKNATFYVSFSCGIASYPKYGDPVTLCEAADMALYEAKDSGRDRTIVAAR
jgi:diguanylate cyclase (GGDEF)-like protein